MNKQDFFIQHNGKYLDYDGVFGPQCVDVIKQYFQDVLSIPVHKGNAIDYWINPPLEKIPKTLFNHPEAGDIIVWNKGDYGHIGICNWWRWWDFNAFQQNDPLGSPCRFKDYTYKDVLGWLRPRPVIEIAIVNAENGPVGEFLLKLGEYTKNAVSFVIKPYKASISVPSGSTLTTEKAMVLIDQLDIKEKFVFILYPNNNSAYEVASYYPARKTAFATIPYPCYGTIMIHAFLHLIRKYVNSNRIKPYVEDVEKYPTTWSDSANYNNIGWQFQSQYDQLKDHWKKKG